MARPSFKPADLTLPQMLRERAHATPNGIAIRQKDFGIWNPCSWKTYWQRTCNVALGMDALGVRAGGHVGIISENRLEWVLAQMAAGAMGAVAVGVYPSSPAAEASYVLAHADVELVFCEDQEQAEKVLESLEHLPALRHMVVMETKGFRNYPESMQARIHSFKELEALGQDHAAKEAEVIDTVLSQQTLDDIGLMIYTSGSTGKPKGAMISYRNMRAVVPGIVDRLELDADSRHLSYLPLCHVAEQMLTTFVPIYLGSQVNFGESLRTVQEDLREVAPTLFLGVPRIWEKLHAAITIKMQESRKPLQFLYRRALAACEPFAHKSSSQRSLRERLLYGFWYCLVLRALLNFIGLRKARVALTGAAPISPSVIRYFRTLGVPLIEVYGLTESTGMILGQPLDDVRWGSVGISTTGVECRCSDSGELMVKGDVVFAGYYKSPDQTKEVIRDGWLYTGDVARQEGDTLYIIDRLKDVMITAGGKNLTPSEIENAVKASPFIKECVIVADRRKFVAALIQIDFETVSKWAESRGLAFTHFRSLAENPEVRALVHAEVEKANSQLAEVAHIRRFHLLTKELDHDDGEVTATMKVRRANIYDAYGREIEALYA